jgi:phosphoglycolate phosphatase-like HAD superfamily hydrolase
MPHHWQPIQRAIALLLLFDIDGTMVRNAASEHARALRRALHEVHGLGSPNGDPDGLPQVRAAGRTDMEIAREIALICGLPIKRFDERRSELIAICLREYAHLVPDDLSDKVVDGMSDLLAELSRRSDVVLSLVTGNLEGVARLKLDRAGIGRFFAAGQGAFGSDSDDRTDLPPLARRRAGALVDGRPYPRERTILIGDTDLDISCALADGVRCIAVTTGPLQAHELQGADVIAHSTSQLRSLLLEA